MLGNFLHLTGGPRRDEKFSATISIATRAMIVVSLFLASVGVYWATHQSDVVSVERQSRIAQHAIELSVDELALQQETVAVWDESASRLVGSNPAMVWVHENMGMWLHRIFGHNEVFIIDGADRPIYAAVGGATTPLNRFAVLSPDLGGIVKNLRRGVGAPNGKHDRNPGHAVLHPETTVRTTNRATHVSRIMLVGDRPAAASAMLIQPSTKDFVKPNGRWPILISIRYLDADFLTELSSRHLISAPRFSHGNDRQAREHSVHLKTEEGSSIGHLIWQPELPGTRIMWRLVPLNLLILLGLAAFTGFLGRRLRSAASELATAETHSKHLAFHDSLTGLPNRAFFQSRLDEVCCDDEVIHFALTLLDVDDFKLTNDSLGHDAGDALLRTLASRLSSVIRPGDLVARLGGDEFALLLVDKSDPVELTDFCNTLLAKLRDPFEYNGKQMQWSASMGASTSLGVDSARNMLKHADLALYEAKASGGGAYRLYHPAMWSSMILRSEMLVSAASALDGGFIKPFYQPQVQLSSGKILGFEALLRCCLPGEVPRGPDGIAAAFEDPGLAIKLSDRMIDGVISDIIEWRMAGLQFGHVAINAALAELRSGSFADRLLAKLEKAGIPPECIQIEVTESVLLGRGIEKIERTFHKLAEKGIRLALDDFGTGFASLTHLKRFPIEIIKIDRSFIRDLQADAEDGAIVDALIGLGQALKIEVVAEGIETAAQRDFLGALGCTVGQGFLFGHAIPGGLIPCLLQTSRSPARAAA